MLIIKKKLKDMERAAYNPRKELRPGDAEFEKLKASLERFGYVEPIIWNKRTGNIVGGHQRASVLEFLGYEEADTVEVDMDEYEEKALNIALNKISGDWEAEKLEDLLRDIQLNSDVDLELTGFNMEEIEALYSGALESLEEEEEEEEYGQTIEEDEYSEEVEPRAKRGEVYRLGDHVLMCGDSTSPEDVAKLMQDVRVDLVFTDPPYGMKKESVGVTNDNLNYADLLEFNRKWIPLSFKYTKDNASWYCWGIDEPLMDIYSNILKPMQKENKITFRNLITWNKGNGQGQLSSEFRMFPIADEKCLFVMCGVQGISTNADNYFEAWEPVRSYLEKEIKKIGESDQKIANALGYKDGRTVNHWWSKSQWTFPTEDNFKALQEYAKSKGVSIFENINGIKAEYYSTKEEYYSTRAYFDNTHDNMNNVWHFKRTSTQERESAGGHATPKPLDLCARAIKSSCRRGGTVLDLFGGSGSTLIASEELGRKCYMMEYEPHWVDVIIERFERRTGKKAELISGELVSSERDA